ncbi:IS256 family transposase [Limnovirga soli]|uniref:Mutator family transposase n=1 Tax=Limnovirga soli TaxID=2656915 RepID=A0A8J8JW52_9BACT|nr:IS256 family transposase [Limnovirga soli]NNV58055.1 IS256 family transposase [Limnovirga soli]
MQSKNKDEQLFPKGFFKQFKDKDSFQHYFNSIFKQGIEEMLQGEMDEHLGYHKHTTEGYNSGNSRNGSFSKTVTTENVGDVILNIPRDRNGQFEPQIIPKGETISAKIQEAILGMYSRGMTTSDVRKQVEAVYGLEISETTVSNITERIMDSAREWQQRTLEPVYFAVWMDGIVIKIREDKKVINKCVYIVIGLKPDGLKEVLGFWIEKTESAAFWMTVLTELKARGLQDILIACTDNLKGFTQAISAVFPEAVTQLCIVHQIRNSCKFVVYKDRRDFCKDLKVVYTAINKEIALEELEKFKQKWQRKYKYAITSWEENWDNLSNYFEYPLELRKIIYTTNAIENLNRGIRKYTKTKTQFPNENAASKSIYLSIKNIEEAWTQPIPNWGLILHQYLIIFESRCRL